MLCFLLALSLCAGLVFLAHEGRDSVMGRDVAILAGVLAGMLVGLCAGSWFGASKWGWHSGETWYAVLYPALLGCMSGPLLGGGLAAWFARQPGRPRFLTAAVASGIVLLISLLLTFVYSKTR